MSIDVKLALWLLIGGAAISWWWWWNTGSGVRRWHLLVLGLVAGTLSAIVCVNSGIRTHPRAFAEVDAFDSAVFIAIAGLWGLWAMPDFKKARQLRRSKMFPRHH